MVVFIRPELRQLTQMISTTLWLSRHSIKADVSNLFHVLLHSFRDQFLLQICYKLKKDEKLIKSKPTGIRKLKHANCILEFF